MVDQIFREGRPGTPGVYGTVALLCVLLLAPAAASRAQTNGAYATHPPVFFDVRRDRALVYLVNDLTDGTARVYIDGAPIGFLPRQSYTAAMVDPGFRLLWGTAGPKWYEFKAGWAYLLRLVRMGALARAWVEDNPGIIAALVADKRLRYVTTDRETLARQRLKAEKAYREALKRAGNEFALPYRRRFYTADLQRQPTAALQAER
ncbi:MAG: hypothetical protein BMS9Abin10_0821 [Gammaproteobacteria bacterium]|nr:MAG: hypothetical protein BMS9Abin10_0821 [Gammaproteobacteria bacterium]